MVSTMKTKMPTTPATTTTTTPAKTDGGEHSIVITGKNADGSWRGINPRADTNLSSLATSSRVAGAVGIRVVSPRDDDCQSFEP